MGCFVSPEVIQDQKQSLKRMNNSRKVKNVTLLFIFCCLKLLGYQMHPTIITNLSYQAKICKKKLQTLNPKKYGIISQHVF